MLHVSTEKEFTDTRESTWIRLNTVMGSARVRALEATLL
jgi:hypothetical protein